MQLPTLESLEYFPIDTGSACWLFYSCFILVFLIGVFVYIGEYRKRDGQSWRANSIPRILELGGMFPFSDSKWCRPAPNRLASIIACSLVLINIVGFISLTEYSRANYELNKPTVKVVKQEKGHRK